MNESSPEPRMTWQFIRVNAVRIVIGAVLVGAVSIAVFVWMPYQRERRIAKEIRALGGEVEWEYSRPYWISQSVRDRMPFLNRIASIDLDKTDASAELLSDIGTLTNLGELFLTSTQITDAELKHLKRLTNLRTLGLTHIHVTDAGLEHLKELTCLKVLYLDTKVTDAGLEHLKGLKNLTVLGLHGTQTSVEGRAMLRKAMPGCKIEPNP